YFGGDLTKLAKRAYDKSIEMRESWWRELLQCLQGVEYLHREAQMHLDIKEPNTMLRHDDFKNPEVVLVDFGRAQSFCSKVTGISGTPGYIPPETWKRYRWQPQGDIFSLGVVFFQLLAARVPLPGPDAAAGIFQVQAKSVQEVGQQTITNQPPWQLFPTR
ncbi:BRI1, partial [Symbiodinium sp. CCMP2592]